MVDADVLVISMVEVLRFSVRFVLVAAVQTVPVPVSVHVPEPMFKVLVPVPLRVTEVHDAPPAPIVTVPPSVWV